MKAVTVFNNLVNAAIERQRLVFPLNNLMNATEAEALDMGTSTTNAPPA